MTGPSFCVSVGRMSVPLGWTAPLHAHPFTEMMVLLSGRLAVELDGRTLTAGPGEVLTYAPTSRHREQVRGGHPAEFIYFAHRLDVAGIPAVARDTDGRIRLLADWLLQASRNGEAEAALADAHLMALLAEVRRAAQPAPDPLLSDLRGWMRDHLGDHITVVQLARRAGLSRAHFIRTYRAFAGRTPMDDLRRLRVEVARDLVITTGHPLRTIAAQVGFCDEYHLSRTFRRYLGVPPTHYRC